MHRAKYIFCMLMVSINCLCTLANVHHVGQGRRYPGFSEALAVTKPGDTIMMHAGTYAGGMYVNKLQRATIMAAPSETVIIQGGAFAFHFTDAVHVYVHGFVFQQQIDNALNIDDGGSYDTPSHHITIDGCIFRDIRASGNNDLLKLSGVDVFEIKNCSFINGAAGGSGIDLVGCHNGSIVKSHFENLGSNSIQLKGGSSNIEIRSNLFRNGGERAINLGGSTGLKFFRPLDAKYEAADLTVVNNLFIGSAAPVAFVGCIRTKVVNNTFYLPQKWVLRILQETTDTSRFYACGNNSFIDNIIYRDNRVGVDCNVGAHTDPQSFTFTGNCWYHAQDANWRGPALPVKETNAIIGKDPLFTNAGGGDFTLRPASPAIGKGFTPSLAYAPQQGGCAQQEYDYH